MRRLLASALLACAVLLAAAPVAWAGGSAETTLVVVNEDSPTSWRVANTYAKLEKLTMLARRKTLFDDRPKEIQELTFIIKEDMNVLNR